MGKKDPSGKKKPLFSFAFRLFSGFFDSFLGAFIALKEATTLSLACGRDN